MNTSRRSAKIFTALSLILWASTIDISAQPSIYTLQIGTKIRVRMDNEINSQVSGINDTFTATVASPVTVRDVEILPAGAIIEGKVVSVKPASGGKTDGRLEVKFDILRLPNEIVRRIDASLVNQNLTETKSSFFSVLSIFGGTAAGAILGAITGKGKGALIGAGVGAGAGTAASLLKKGKEARIKADQEFEIRLNEEVTLPAKDF